MDNCIFCKIVNNEIPSYTVYEDDIVKVFLDINPESVGHMLIVPKKHFTCLEDIDMDTLTYINNISKKMYALVNDRLNIDGLSIIQNNGCAQEVKHYHMHIIPKYINDISLSVEEVYKKLVD